MAAIATMSRLPFSLLLIVTLISLPSCISSHQGSTTRPTGFKTQLINRNSVQSPFYNPKLTRSDRIKASVLGSFARHNYIESLISKKVSPSTSLGEFPPLPREGEYIMKYFIGTPSIETYGILDTGSGLIWLQCQPCVNCFHQSKVQIFNPARSSSYKQLLCKDRKCYQLGGIDQCSKDYKCEYHAGYADKSYSVGAVAEETITFRDVYGVNNTAIEPVVIGCGHNNSFTVKGEGIPGIIGLLRNRMSIIDQFNFPKFSYCLGMFDEPDRPGYITFGDEATISGYKTTLVPVPQHITPMYFVQLEDISVDGIKLSIPKGTFDISANYPRGFIIDTGATFTFLNKTAFDMLVSNLSEKLVKLKKVADPNKDFDLCYRMGTIITTQFVPKITFHFTGLDMDLPSWNTWLKVQGNIYCLAMYPTNSYSILGNFQQQNFDVGYDLVNNVVSMSYGYCSIDD
ncbi:hypothetical protein AQUCO_03700150v1 [Aquilegia coerulea]|uniref:Peptidase A1 domain-containing protein n=1 Tax=Aquilegia coerulea TaxID=218851 RepID=A0A2G5CTQ4_AQUCA|nr:hypothetical protein AQUCO_03700150v1 [Aquilegia coerulea]